MFVESVSMATMYYFLYITKHLENLYCKLLIRFNQAIKQNMYNHSGSFIFSDILGKYYANILISILMNIIEITKFQ